MNDWRFNGLGSKDWHWHTRSTGCSPFYRHSDTFASQVEAFFDVHEQCGSVPGGVHLEMTGENVTECIGGGSQLSGFCEGLSTWWRGAAPKVCRVLPSLPSYSG
eukprot:scaffold16415_cov18-Prasinocladus_malaysianus.AAC.1